MSSRGERDGEEEEEEDDGGTDRGGEIRRAAVRTRVLCPMPRRQSCLLGCAGGGALLRLLVCTSLGGRKEKERAPLFHSVPGWGSCY